MNKRNLLLMSSMLACMGVYGQQTVLMNELDLSKIWQEYGSVTNGTTVTGDAAVLEGNIRKDVLGLHAKALAKVKLDGKALRFTTQIGIVSDKVKEDDPSLVVQPLVDGTKLLFAKNGDSKQFKALVVDSNRKVYHYNN